jgi:hypothetical protein
MWRVASLAPSSVISPTADSSADEGMGSLLPLLARDNHSDHNEATYEVRARYATGRAMLNANLSLKVEHLRLV